MASVKTIGKSGQIALGKDYANRQVLVDELEPGVWIIKLGEFIPDNERWMLGSPVKEQIDRALAWAAQNPATASDLADLAAKVAAK